jgi:hypothetical protein
VRRREFVKAAAAVLALSAIPVGAAPKSWQEMSFEELVRHFAHLRRMGVAPNFDCQHTCPRCGVEYLCPDRYVMPECGPSRAMQQVAGTSSIGMLCTSCSTNVETHGPAGYRQWWLEAHAV